MKRWILASTLALLLGTFVACTFTIDDEALMGGLSCSPSTQKECEAFGEPLCVDLTNPDYGCARLNCIPCNLPNAQPTCSPVSGQCVIAACTGNWANCDGAASNGCEANLANDENNCGACGSVCPSRPNADVACGSARCYIRLCDSGFKDCNNRINDGCETDVRSDPANCGDCGTTCDSGECVAGECVEGLE